ncbi:MAG TPA: glycosyltransferase 61 family protein [Nocardioidaceae bacterium]|nr:glycosyltransferase 61 family protein [Nocardioidaceae bacterium]
MSRLPSALQPAWPLFKRVHRLLSFVLGLVFRRTSRLAGQRALPHRATLRAADTAALEPDAVVLHPAGPGEELVRTMPVGTPADHWVFQDELTYDVPARFCLEIENGTTVGDYAAIVTPGGTLDYETSGYFGISSWREHPLFLRPQLPPIEKVDGTLLNLTTRGSSANYYHFLLDVLPRYGIFREALPDRWPDAVYVPHTSRYQKQLLAMTGIDQLPLLPAGGGTALRADRLLVPSTPNQELAAPTWVVDWLRRNLPASAASDLPTKLYVTRGDAPNTRRYVEEPELWPLLERQGFARVDPGTLTVQEQIDVFAAADVVVAPHGAALSNLVFCKPGVRILELFAANYVNHCYWTIACAVPGTTYQYLVADGSHRTGRPMTGVLTDIRIPASQVLAALDDLLSR